MGWIISVVSGKGGPGKSTMCRTLADCYHGEGLRAAVLDLDPNLNALAVYELATQAGIESTCAPVFEGNDRVSEHIDELSRRFDVLLCDTPGRYGARVIDALTMSHAAIITVGMGYIQVKEALKTVQAVQQVQTTRPSTPLPYRLIPSASPSSKVQRDTRQTLIDAGEGPRVDAGIAYFREVPAAEGYGKSIVTYRPKSAGAAAFRQVAATVTTMLNEAHQQKAS